MSKEEITQFIEELHRIAAIIRNTVVPDLDLFPKGSREITTEWRYLLNDLERDVNRLIEKAEIEL